MSTAMGRSGTSDGPREGGLLVGDRVLVTGGSGGIGQGICDVAAREGARVAFTYCKNDDGARATERLIARRGAEALAIRADLCDREAAARVVKAVEDAWDGVDVLVNNAAASEAVPFILLDDEDIDALLELNILAAMRLARHALRGMVRRKSGRIVNISSITGSRSLPGPVHYAVSKGALDGLTRSLAHEVGAYNVLVNGIAAGIFEGGLRQTIPEHHQQRYISACALSRLGQPAECGELVAWLASKHNTYVNGTVILQDGGTVG